MFGKKIRLGIILLSMFIISSPSFSANCMQNIRNNKKELALSGAYALVLTAGLGFSIYTIAWASGNPEPSCDWEQVGFVDYPVCVNRTKLGPLVVNSSFEECYFYTGLYRDCRGVSDASVMCLMKVLPGGVVIVKDSMMKSDSVLVLGGLMGIVTSSLCLQAVLSRVLQIVVGD